MMEKLKFEFSVGEKKGDEKTNSLFLTSISTQDGEIFDAPSEFQDISLHTELTKTDTFKKVKNAITKRHQKRNVWIVLNDALKAIYIDDGGNIQFADFILEERYEEPQATGQTSNAGSISREELTMILERFAKTETESRKNLNKLAEKFVLENLITKTVM